MDTMRSGSKRLIREINESLVLRAVRSTTGVSRTEISRQSGLSLPTVSGITAAMLGRGLLEERDPGPVGRGRPPVLLALNARAGGVIGVKLTETHVIAVLTDLQAAVLARTTVDTASTAVTAVVEAMTRAVHALRPQAGDAPIYGIGVGMAGVVGRTGVVHHATYANWGEIDLAGLAEEATGLSTLVDNDVNALVAHEQWFGAGRGMSDFMVVSIGRGIGLGLVMNGQLQRGARGGVGELGHVKIVRGGPTCACGDRGCLEATSALPAIATRLARQIGRPLDATAVLDLADSGNEDATQELAAAGLSVGRAVGNVVNIVNPRLVVLTGEAVSTDNPIGTAFAKGLAETAFTPLHTDLDVVVEPLSDDAWAQGAASLLLGDLFTPRLQTTDTGRPSLAVG